MAAADTLKEINVEVKRCSECGARFGIDAAFCPFDGSPLSTSTWDKGQDPRAQKGFRVDDRYEVLEPIGEGGMGTVYKVRHVTLNRLFAMKVLRRDLATDADLAQRFLQEARATAAVKHPAIVAITDFGEMEDGIPYFVMELLEGETVATRIRARGPIPPRAAIRIARQIAEGLSASHAANVIHRDLKPDNVFLLGKDGRAAEEEIRIVDFGAAKIIGGSKLTRPGIVFGTPYYMSPEQASGVGIDGRADVYSLGVLLYEMLTGRVPFEADTYMGVLTKHMFQKPARPVPPAGIQLGDLEDIVMRALAKDPNERYESMPKMAAALERAAHRRASSAPFPVSGTAPILPRPSLRSGHTKQMPQMSTADRIELSVSRRVAAEAQRKRRFYAIIAVAACTTLALGAGLISLLSPSERQQEQRPITRASASSSGAAQALLPPPPPPPVIDPPVATESVATAGVSSPSAPARKPTPAAPPTALASKPRPTPAAAPTLPPPATTSTGGGTKGPDDFKDPWKR